MKISLILFLSTLVVFTSGQLELLDDLNHEATTMGNQYEENDDGNVILSNSVNGLNNVTSGPTQANLTTESDADYMFFRSILKRNRSFKKRLFKRLLSFEPELLSGNDDNLNIQETTMPNQYQEPENKTIILSRKSDMEYVENSTGSPGELSEPSFEFSFFRS